MGILVISGIIAFLVILIKHLSDRAAYNRKIACYEAERRARLERITIQRANEKPLNPPRATTRKHAKPEIDGFLNVKRKTNIIVFDVETNGLSKEYSVLSCSAIKYQFDPNAYEMKEVDRFDRYYYPLEEFNPSATAVNGLTRTVIDERRADASYSRNFNDDHAFEDFCKGVNRFIAHNISFDCKFVSLPGKVKFCTMITNTDIVAASMHPRKNEWKWPTLSETATYYGIEYNKCDLHMSMVDTEVTAKIFMKMLTAARGK